MAPVETPPQLAQAIESATADALIAVDARGNALRPTGCRLPLESCAPNAADR